MILNYSLLKGFGIQRKISVLKLVLFTLIVFFISVQSGNAAINDPVVLTDQTKKILLGKSLEIFEDKIGNFTIDDVSSSDFNSRFTKSNEAVPIFGYTESAYWVRFKVTNESMVNDSWLLEIGYSFMHYVDMYTFSSDSNQFNKKLTGVLRPVKTRDLPFHRIIFKLPVTSKSEQVIYLRFQNDSSMTLSLILWAPSAFNSANKMEYLWIGLYFGILFIMLFYNMFLLFSLRTSDYFYYVIFLINFILFDISYSGIGALYFWPDLYKFNYISVHLFFTFLVISMLKFSSVFLMTKKQAPLIHRIFNVLIGIWILLIILNPIAGYNFVAQPMDFFMIISFVGAIIAAFIVWLKGYRPARFYLLSWQLVITGAVIAVLVRENYLPSNIFTEHSYQVGVVLMIIMWSLALADRINQLKIEAESANKELKKERDINKELFQKSPAFIVAIDSEGKIAMMNDTMCNRLGYNFSDIIGKDYMSLFIPGRDRENVLKIFEILATTRNATVSENSILTSDGQEFLVEWHGSQIYDEKNNFKFFFGMGIDITDRKRFEEQLRQAQKMETVGTLAGGLAHDFNNILSGIMGTVSLIKYKLVNKENVDDKILGESIDMIGESTKRATSIISQLLSLSRQQELNFEPVDLNNSIENVINICKNSFNKSIEINSVLSDKAAIVKADSTQIEQVILNLCINSAHAMTFMRKKNELWGGELILSIEYKYSDENFYEIHPEAKEKEYWQISISDTGIGMDDNVISRIYNPFFTTKKSEEGTGLGLSIVYNIIQQHNGFMDVHSEVNKGSTFKLYLPVIKETVIDKKIDAEEKNVPQQQGLILVVDDEEIIRKTTTRILKECGYEVILASDGIEGVEIFKERYKEISAVLLDMSMPKLSGKGTFKKMKNIDPDVKVLLSSGFREDERVSDAFALGADEFIQKPYTFEKLAQAIDRVINKS